MSLFDTTQIALERAISGATLRHEVLSGNLANVNTPGFTPREVDFHGALREALSFGTSAVEHVEIAPTTVQTRALRFDGNGVDVDVESAKLAENGLELNALVQVAGTRIDILRTAMGSR